jgi:hypothetical protein
MNEYDFFKYWLSFTVLIQITSAVVLYAVFRAGHFRDQERARHLALWAEVPGEGQLHLQPRVPTSPEHTACTRGAALIPPGAGLVTAGRRQTNTGKN